MGPQILENALPQRGMPDLQSPASQGVPTKDHQLSIRS